MLSTKKAKYDCICFLDAALLFEKKWDKYCDFIILADVDYKIQKKRVMLRDNISEDDFDKINNIQLKNSDKKVLICECFGNLLRVISRVSMNKFGSTLISN